MLFFQQCDNAIEGTRGPVVNPLIRVAARAADDMVRYASEFGMTPVARTRIQAGIGAEVKSKFGDLLA